MYVFLGLADAALGEGTGVKLNKLSVREIKAVRVPFSVISLFLSARVLFLALRNDTPSETAGERRWRWWRLLIQTAIYAEPLAGSNDQQATFISMFLLGYSNYVLGAPIVSCYVAIVN